jgi:hypothetical protein
MAHNPLRTYLRTYRLRTGLSHDDLAFLLGSSIHGSSVGKHERGHRLPMLRNVIAHEIVLGASLHELYEGTYEEVRLEVLRRVRALHGLIERKRRGPHRVLKLTTLRALLDSAAFA